MSTAVARTRGEPGPLLEILHAVQNELGCVPPEAVPLLADALNLSRAEVHGVISFYHHFREHAPGQYMVQLCRAEACQSMNARALEEFVRGKLRVNFGETHRRRARHPRSGVLPRQLRLRAGHDGERRIARPRDPRGDSASCAKEWGVPA